MMIAEAADSKHRLLRRLFNALVDPARSDRTMGLLLLCYLVIWWLYAVIAKSSQDIHIDMGEMVVWGHEVVLGTPKHPPLGAWLVWLWFSVFPRTDWAYYLFAMILPTGALWATWKVSEGYLPNSKRIFGLATLSLVPFYNFQAFKFNANTVLTPLWALTAWWFLRSFETRRTGWALLAGVAAAASVLGKYWSIVMLAGLAIAALMDPRRDKYFASLAPYLTIAIGTILLTPHLDWVISHQFNTVSYAFAAHPATALTGLFSGLVFVATSLAYVAAPLVLSALIAQPSMAEVVDTVWPAEAERRFFVVAFAAPLAFIIPLAGTPAGRN